MLEGINCNDGNSKMVFYTQKNIYSVHISWTIHIFNKSQSYEQSLTIQVVYYYYDIGSLTIMTVSENNEVQDIVKWTFKLYSSILLLPAH